MITKKEVWFFMFSLIILAGCNLSVNEQIQNEKSIQANHKNYEGKKFLYIDSYHEGYEWSDGITAGIREGLKDTAIDLKIFRMDTKNHPEEEFKLQSALNAKFAIEDFKPDIVIVSDDIAFKYIVKEYYKDSALPVVFCGLNWDASVYGAPYSNTAGMLEVALVPQLIDHLKTYAKGNRIGYLSADTETERKNAEYYLSFLNIIFTKQYFVTTMDDWEDKFLKLQDEVDMLIFENSAGIADWNENRAKLFAEQNSKIPVGTTNTWTMQSSLIGLTKLPDEQGEWSAETALRILDGEKPSDIPLAKNKKGELMLNLNIADKLNIAFSPTLIKNAKRIIE